MDWEYRYIHANRLALRQTGKSLEQLRGHTPWELFPGLEDSPWQSAYREAMEVGKPASTAPRRHRRSLRQAAPARPRSGRCDLEPVAGDHRAVSEYCRLAHLHGLAVGALQRAVLEPGQELPGRMAAQLLERLAVRRKASRLAWM